MQIRVFYSWQSDRPPADNRNFILSALEKVAKEVKKDDSIAIDPVIDRDTSGVTGSPDIVSTILEKIDKSDVVVCDVTQISSNRTRTRKTPNPNVLIELGYALGKLGPLRVLLVINTDYGKIEDLPFDLKSKRVIPYSCGNGDEDRTQRREVLKSILKSQIIEIAKEMERAQEKYGTRKITIEDRIADIKSELERGTRSIKITEMLRGETETIHRKLQSSEFAIEGEYSEERFQTTVLQYISLTSDIRRMLAALVFYDINGSNVGAVVSTIERLCQVGNRPGIELFRTMQYFPAYVITQSTGTVAMSTQNYHYLSSTLEKPIFRDAFDNNRRKPAVLILNSNGVMEFAAQKIIPYKSAKTAYTPLSDFLIETLREAVEEYLPSEADYIEAFDLYNSIHSLCYRDHASNDWFPISSYYWRYRHEKGNSPVYDYLDHQSRKGEHCDLTMHGLFGGNILQYREVLKKLWPFISEVIRRWH